MTCLNLTQHAATPEQRATGVVDVTAADKPHLTALLTFDALPLAQEVRDRADALAAFAWHYKIPRVMIGGAPFLMERLAIELRARGMKPVFAFSRRESVEEPQPDGSVRKTQVFRHAGFVEV